MASNYNDVPNNSNKDLQDVQNQINRVYQECVNVATFSQSTVEDNQTTINSNNSQIITQNESNVLDSERKCVRYGPGYVEKGSVKYTIIRERNKEAVRKCRENQKKIHKELNKKLLDLQQENKNHVKHIEEIIENFENFIETIENESNEQVINSIKLEFDILKEKFNKLKNNYTSSID